MLTRPRAVSLRELTCAGGHSGASITRTQQFSTGHEWLWGLSKEQHIQTEWAHSSGVHCTLSPLGETPNSLAGLWLQGSGSQRANASEPLSHLYKSILRNKKSLLQFNLPHRRDPTINYPPNINDYSLLPGDYLESCNKFTLLQSLKTASFRISFTFPSIIR